MADAPLTLFLPFGSGYGNPGLTIRAESIDELNALMADLSTAGEDELSKLDTLLDSVLTVKAGVLLKFPHEEKASSKPVVTHPQAQPSPADAPSCAHGTMRWKDAVTKSGPNAGKHYTAWVCSAPYGAGEQCKMKDFKYV